MKNCGDIEENFEPEISYESFSKFSVKSKKRLCFVHMNFQGVQKMDTTEYFCKWRYRNRYNWYLWNLAYA